MQLDHLPWGIIVPKDVTFAPWKEEPSHLYMYILLYTFYIENIA